MVLFNKISPHFFLFLQQFIKYNGIVSIIPYIYYEFTTKRIFQKSLILFILSDNLFFEWFPKIHFWHLFSKQFVPVKLS